MRKLIMAAALALVLGAGVTPPAQAQINLQVPQVINLTLAQVAERQKIALQKMKGINPTAAQATAANLSLAGASTYATASLPSVNKRKQFLSLMVSPVGCTKTFIEGNQTTFGFASLADLNAAKSIVKVILLCPPDPYSSYIQVRKNFINAILANPLFTGYTAQHMAAFGYNYSLTMFQDLQKVLDILHTPQNPIIIFNNQQNQ